MAGVVKSRLSAINNSQIDFNHSLNQYFHATRKTFSMDEHDNYEDMGLGTTTNIDELKTATPSTLFPHSAATYSMDYQAPDDHDMSMSNETAHGVLQQEHTSPITHSTMPGSDEPPQTAAADTNAANEIAEETREDATVAEEEDWMALLDFDIPDFTQARITHLPQFQALYDTYHASYANSAITNSTRMKQAMALAFVLLMHYYPASQGYVIEPSSLGPIAQHGMSFILEAEDGSDIWHDLPAKKPTKKAKKGGGLTKKQKEAAEIAGKTAEYNRGLSYTIGLKWHWIKPEDIAGFVVKREVKVTDKKTGVVTDKVRPHTYLAIMIDNSGELPRFSKENTTHRSDVLADALCRNAEIEDGYGILFYGPRLECYRYEAGADWVHYENDDNDHNAFEDEAQDTEPRLYPFHDAQGVGELMMDMRTTSLQTVDRELKRVAEMNVTYMDDAVSYGVEQPTGVTAGAGDIAE